MTHSEVMKLVLIRPRQNHWSVKVCFHGILTSHKYSSFIYSFILFLFFIHSCDEVVNQNTDWSLLYYRSVLL